MNFQKLPTSLVESIVNKVDFETVAKLSQTCSSVNNIIKKKKLDRIDVDRVSFVHFVHMDKQLTVLINRSPQFSGEKNCYGFDESYSFFDIAPELLELEKVRQVLTSIKSVCYIEFSSLIIDEAFIQMLKSMSIDWRKVNAEFDKCIYDVPKLECLAMWRMFGSADVREGEFMEEMAEVINDEMMLQTLPAITFTTTTCYIGPYGENPNMTDRSLEFLADNPPSVLSMGHFVSNFSADGIIQLFQKVVNSQSSTAAVWFIGSVRLDFHDFAQILVRFREFETDNSTVLTNNVVHLNFYEITVIYKRKNSSENGNISVILIKPQEVLDHDQNVHDWHPEQVNNIEI